MRCPSDEARFWLTEIPGFVHDKRNSQARLLCGCSASANTSPHLLESLLASFSVPTSSLLLLLHVVAVTSDPIE